MKPYKEESPTYQIGSTAVLSKKAIQRDLKKSGVKITLEQMSVLNILVEKDHVTMTEISEKNIRDNSATTRVVDILVKKGFLQRETSSSDRRALFINLTESGKMEVMKANNIGRKYVSKITKGIDEEELNIFLSVIKQMKKNIISLYKSNIN